MQFVLAYVLDALIMQSTTADSLVASISAIALFVSVVAGLATGVLTMISKNTTNKRVKELAEAGLQITESIKATDKAVLDNMDKIKTVVEVAENVSPEAKKLLQKHQADLDSVTREANRLREEIGRLYDTVPAISTAATTDAKITLIKERTDPSKYDSG